MMNPQEFGLDGGWVTGIIAATISVALGFKKLLSHYATEDTKIAGNESVQSVYAMLNEQNAVLRSHIKDQDAKITRLEAMIELQREELNRNSIKILELNHQIKLLEEQVNEASGKNYFS